MYMLLANIIAISMHSPAIKHKDFVPFFPQSSMCVCVLQFLPSADGGGGGAAAVFFSLSIRLHNSFLHFHSFALYLAGILRIHRTEKEGGRESEH